MGSGGGWKEELCNPYEDAGRIYGAVGGRDTIGKPAESLQARGPPAGVLRPVKRVGQRCLRQRRRAPSITLPPKTRRALLVCSRASPCT